MRYQLWPIVVTVPALTPASSPLTATWRLTVGHLERIIIDVPSGHKGQTGLALAYQGTQYIPFTAGSWLILDQQTKEVKWADEVMEQGFTVRAYNTGKTPHTFWLYAEIWPEISNAGTAAIGGTDVTVRRVATHQKVARLRREAGTSDLLA